jgi:hypothetical protein
MMPERDFWQIIETTRQKALAVKKKDRRADFMQTHIDALIAHLQSLSTDEIAAFDGRFRNYVRQAYRWDLWGALYWLAGGCSDGAFWNARCVLISLGQEKFTRILENPDCLAEVEEEPDVYYEQVCWQSEGFQYVAEKAHQAKTGKGLSRRRDDSGPPREPTGERFDFQDRTAMQRRFPKLVAKYPDMGD